MAGLVLTLCTVALGAGPVVGEIERVGEGYTFSEGPLWVPGTGWIFSDVPEEVVHALDGEPYRRESGGTNGTALDLEGRVVCAEGASGRVTRIESDGSITVLASEYEGERFNAPNDLVVASDGTIYFTDPKPLRGGDQLKRDFTGVYAIDPDGTVRLLVADLKYPNGIGLSPDEKTLYVALTTGREIRAFDLGPDGATNGRAFCEVTLPDGFAVDAAGRIWCASSGGVSVFDVDGTLIATVATKPMPTNCAIGGESGDTLLITARQNVFAVKISVP